jgi:hypothetical protein
MSSSRDSYRVQGFEINAFYPSRRHLSAKVRVFIDMLVDRFQAAKPTDRSCVTTFGRQSSSFLPVG